MTYIEHKTDLPYGYCGMPCALCTRFRTEGKSRCAGCSAGGYYTDVCKVYRCCRERELPHCSSCPDFKCERLGKMSDFRDFDTGRVKPRTCESVRRDGFDAWYIENQIKAELLTEALSKYNNGRMKRFICETFIKNDIAYLRGLMKQMEALQCADKDKPAEFRRLAERP